MGRTRQSKIWVFSGVNFKTDKGPRSHGSPTGPTSPTAALRPFLVLRILQSDMRERPRRIAVHLERASYNMNILGEGRFVRLVERDTYEFVERKNCTGIISVVAITAEDEMIFVEQYRHAVDSRTIELVAGLVGDQGEESLETAVHRELVEEAGYEAEELHFLMNGPSSGGITAAQISFFLARDVVKVSEGGGVDDEDITVHVVPVADVHGWLQAQSRAGLLVDPKVYLGLTVAHFGWDGVPAPTT